MDGPARIYRVLSRDFFWLSHLALFAPYCLFAFVLQFDSSLTIFLACLVSCIADA
jgi:hypothetical protein